MEPECFLRENCTLAKFDLTDRLPSVSDREQNPRKSSAESWARWKNRKVAAGLGKKGRHTTCPFVNTAPVLFLSFVSSRLSSLARIVTHSPPSVHLLPAASTLSLARSFVLYSESTFSQYRNRSRIGAWRCAIRRAGREIVLS